MGIEDRDWYREKKIDWDRGGLVDRDAKKRRFRGYAWWIVAAVLLGIAAFLFRLI